MKEVLNIMKILVTGANGYLGSGVVKQLLDDGYEIVATDLCDTYIDKRSRIKCSDLFNLENPYEFFEKPDIVLHLAWRNGFIHNADSHINDLPAHVNFIKKMCESGIKRIAVMGSMHEIGFYEGSINENTVCKPMSFYGIAKDALRNACNLIAQNNNVIFQWFRGFYIVGNTANGSSIFSKIIQAENRGETKFPFTLGQNQFDFIDYEKFCYQVACAVEQDKINGIINICEGRPEKLADRVERFIIENNLKIKLEYGAFPDRPYDSKAVWGDSGRISIILNNRKNNI